MSTGSVCVLRGGGDLATGAAQKLHNAGFRVIILELEKPRTIRRTVALAEAVYTGETVVENLRAVRIEKPDERFSVWDSGKIPVLADPELVYLREIAPVVFVDAAMAKRNIGSSPDFAPVTIALGPGFSAPRDAHAVIETRRGHGLGRIIRDGTAEENTGVPGDITPNSHERVIRSPGYGDVKSVCKIGDSVKSGQVLLSVGRATVKSTIDGVLRGLIADGFDAYPGLKLADIDPRPESKAYCLMISDKARCVGGAVLDAALSIGREKGLFQFIAAAR